MTRFGTPDSANALLEEYHGQLPNEVLLNETDALLAALLMELKAQRFSRGDTEAASLIIEQQRRDYATGTDTEGVYHASEESPDDQGWTEVDLGFTCEEVDLRNISGPVDVAFADPGDGADSIRYDQSDSPVAGIRVRTATIWFQAATGTETLNVEAWR